MIKPEHKDDLQFIARSIFQHELFQKKVYNEKDLVRDYFRIYKNVETIFQDLDVDKLVSSTLY